MTTEREKPFQPEGRNFVRWASGPVGVAFFSTGIAMTVAHGFDRSTTFLGLLGAALMVLAVVLGRTHPPD